MKDWAHAHPVLTFWIIIIGIMGVTGLLQSGIDVVLAR